MKRIGFFSDLSHGLPDAQSLVEAVDQLDGDTAHHVAGYLNSGTVIIPTLGSTCFDVLSAEKTEIGPLGICSDGEWAWPSDLGYYVAKYHAALPAEFIDHARQRRWMPPELSPAEIATATDDLLETS